jgi:copper chaperone
MESLVLGVDGMTCGGCAATVRSALERVPGVKQVVVSLQDKIARIEGERLDRALLEQAAWEAGYEIRGG